MIKTDAIRETAKDHLHWTNQQIKEEVKRKHGLIVSSSAIINVIGSHRRRMRDASLSINLLGEARKFLKMVGSFEQARNLLALAETES
ncbi:hypothetical protein CEE69_16010 [Rhodopirellula bahusiensis]|uniref:Uncharacterized protein n=1 Tax=Rhodopirellula bahusiensis TaxID=2014065 RepID=A0A2G1W549_9BACT|nr:hypothetical protein CEE69_16010 [Rhodopirellula bahusiensis]